MKKFLLPVALIIVAVSNLDAKQINETDVSQFAPAHTLIPRSTTYASKSPRVPKAPKTVWKPCTQYGYWWDEENNEWIENEDKCCSYTYDSNGRIIKVINCINLEPNEQFVEEYRYDEYGNVTEYTASDNKGVVTQKIVCEYDPIVTNLPISSKLYSLNDDELVLEYEERMVITRDANGVITQCNTEIQEGNNTFTSVQINNEVSEKGQIEFTKIEQYDDIADIWEIYQIDNIEWDHTNGQVYSVDEFESKDNGVKHCTVYKYHNASTLQKEHDIDMVWNEDSHTQILTREEYGEIYKEVTEYTELENGGYKTHIAISIVPDPESPEIPEREETYRETYDEYGNMLEFLWTSQDTGEELIINTWIKGEVEYDDEHGYPLTYTTTRQVQINDDDLNPEYDFVNEEKTVFSDYQEITGSDFINNISNDDTQTEYYTLEGLRVSTPSHGLYIRKQGTSVSKILVK